MDNINLEAIWCILAPSPSCAKHKEKAAQQTLRLVSSSLALRASIHRSFHGGRKSLRLISSIFMTTFPPKHRIGFGFELKKSFHHSIAVGIIAVLRAYANTFPPRAEVRHLGQRRRLPHGRPLKNGPLTARHRGPQ